MFFHRKYYLDRLVSAEGNGMIKVITGIRRKGAKAGRGRRSDLDDAERSPIQIIASGKDGPV